MTAIDLGATRRGRRMVFSIDVRCSPSENALEATSSTNAAHEGSRMGNSIEIEGAGSSSRSCRERSSDSFGIPNREAIGT